MGFGVGGFGGFEAGFADIGPIAGLAGYFDEDGGGDACADDIVQLLLVSVALATDGFLLEGVVHGKPFCAGGANEKWEMGNGK